jgi:hypothetical protein
VRANLLNKVSVIIEENEESKSKSKMFPTLNNNPTGPLNKELLDQSIL